jgi:transposase
MIGMDVWVKIKALRAQGLGAKKIARQLGIGKQTVRRYLRQEHVPRYKPRASKIDPYREEIRQRVEQGLTGTRILREIRELGYTGRYSILTDYIRTFRPQPPAMASVRFETLPGQQAQVDWSDFGEITIDGQTYRLSCFAMVLGWSRAQYIEFTISQTLDVFLTCHERAFRFFGGCPKEILYDNLKSVALHRCGRAVEFNSKFLEFAGYYGFEPKLCWPRRAQTKGKVERNFQYVEKDFFLGKNLSTLAEYNREARVWMDTVANCRIHGTTKERPCDRLEQERPHLIAIANQPEFDCAVLHIRKVSRDCMVSFEANRYSVPYRLAGQTVFVYADPERLRVQFDDQWVATHVRVHGKGQMVMAAQHYQGLIPRLADRSWEQCQHEFQALGPHAAEYLAGLTKAHKGNARYHAEKVLRLGDEYSNEQIDAALAQALQYGAWGSRSIENICRQQRAQRAPVAEIVAPVELAATGLVQAPLLEITVQKRDLSVYAAVAEGGGVHAD